MGKFNESSKKFTPPKKPYNRSAQFNAPSERFRPVAPIADTRNDEGALAFTMEDKIRLVSRLLTSMFNEAKFYGDTSKALVNDAIKMMEAGGSRNLAGAKFVANAAIYARKEFHLRSATHVLAAELSHSLKGRHYARKAIAQICERPDDMTEIFSYYMDKFVGNKPTQFKAIRPAGGPKVYNRKISNSLKKGLADAFLNFDEYQLDKYDYKRTHTCKACGEEVTMKLNRGKMSPYCGKCKRFVTDVIVKHPFQLKDIALMCGFGEACKTEEKKSLLGRLLNGTLKTAQTWQTKISAAGGSKAAKQESWEELIRKNKLGYMAALRNLRNMLDARVPAESMQKVYALLSNEKQVLNSKQLTFRFVTAYEEIEKAGYRNPDLFNALEIAARLSCQNLPNLYGKTFMSADDSASMTYYPISENSDVKPAQIAVLLMAMANYICEEAITSQFNQNCRLRPMDGANGIIANARSIRIQGGGTDVSSPIRYALANRIYVDRFIIISDNEINDNANEAMTYYRCNRMGHGFTTQCQAVLEQYRREINPNVWVHAIDLAGYGTQQFKGDRVNIICGWSEKVLEFIHTAETGMGGIVEKIESYYFK